MRVPPFSAGAGGGSAARGVARLGTLDACALWWRLRVNVCVWGGKGEIFTVIKLAHAPDGLYGEGLSAVEVARRALVVRIVATHHRRTPRTHVSTVGTIVGGSGGPGGKGSGTRSPVHTALPPLA